MKFYYKLRDIIGDIDSVESYKYFRNIEDWCTDNLSNNKWKFDYSSTISVYGVDIPIGIEFNDIQDVIAFNVAC